MTTLYSALQRNYNFLRSISFGGNIRVFVATTCFVLPLSTPCCLLEISKCLWHWRWRRSESIALKAVQNLNGVIKGNRMWLDKARSERFLWFSIVVLNNRKLDLSLGQFNVEKGKHILLLLLLLLLFLKVARNISYGTPLHLFPFITRKYVVICVKRRPIVRRYIHLRENTNICA